MTTAFFDKARMRLPYLMRMNGTGMKRVLHGRRKKQSATQSGGREEIQEDIRKTAEERRRSACSEGVVHLGREEREAGTEAAERWLASQRRRRRGKAGSGTHVDRMTVLILRADAAFCKSRQVVSPRVAVHISRV